jgi:hypothetical protein
VTDTTAIAIQTQDATSIMQVIERMAMNPAVDLDKLKGLLDLQERIMTRNAEQSYDMAMNEAQAQMRPIATDANNSSTRSRYASYGALDHSLRPIYTGHGFSLSFGTADGAPADQIRLTCRVAHRDGHKEIVHIDMPADGKGAKGGDVMTKTHATGAAVTYGRRYLLGMIFNIAVGEDRDGNPPDTGEVISDQQLAQIRTLVEETKSDLPSFLRFVGAETLENIRTTQFDRAIKALKAKKGQQK